MTGRYDVDPGQTKGQKGFLNQFQELEDQTDGHKKSLRTSHTSVEEGNLKIRKGNFYVMGDDDLIDIAMIPGAQPLVVMYPKGAASETHAILWFATDNPSLPNLTDQATQLYVGRVSDSQPDGGKVLLSRRFCILSHQPFSDSPYSTAESFIWIAREITSITDKGFSFQGKWPKYQQFTTSDALLMGSVDVGAGAGGVTVSYAGTFISNVIPVITLLQSAGTITWNLTAFNTSGFTVAWGNTTAKTITFWIFRTA